ncbi:MAG: phosphoribosylanthranilate isomerase [Pseudomonadota bacterium]|nr:phosphoribosylanthranilate isomerase [Pseudomonadota bacterium]
MRGAREGNEGDRRGGRPVRVKICGITRPEDGALAAALGADAVGFVFHPKSPRMVGVERARAIVAALPPFVTRVGLFVNAAPDAIEAVLRAVALDVLQFHGEEPAEDCRCYGRPYIKAIRMRPDVDLRGFAVAYHDAGALLLDAYVEGIEGGTGQRFDWSRVPKDLAKPIILAGGLTPDNVTQALAVVNPYAVDVSGGVERDTGIKDEEKMRRFISGVWDVGRG